MSAVSAADTTVPAASSGFELRLACPGQCGSSRWSHRPSGPS